MPSAPNTSASRPSPGTDHPSPATDHPSPGTDHPSPAPSRPSPSPGDPERPPGTSADQPAPDGPAARSRLVAPRPARSEGQWAFGEREPLNGNERTKQEDGGLNVRARVEQTYAAGGFASIEPSDLRGRLRWWGLYTQRRPGIEGGRTATLPPEQLDDEFFMMRVRIDGGAVNVAQLRALGEISTRYARGTADITDRQNVQFHWIRIEDVPTIWGVLEGVGLQTAEACGDTPRVVLGSPLAGVEADELVDGTPAVREIVRRWIGDPELANLPRKFKTAVSGSPHQDVTHEINDISFVGVDHPEHGPGFDVWVGGGLSTTPMLAQRLGAWVPLEDVAEVWYAVARAFRDYGYRRLRSRARLKFLIADWGVERFRAVLETEYLGRRLLDGPPPPAPKDGRRDHIGVHKQRNRKFSVGAAPVAGRVSGPTLTGLAEAAERAGSDRVRFTPEQHVVVLDVQAPQVADLLDDLDRIGLSATASTFRRGILACTGLEYCKLAIVETKGVAARLLDELERRFTDVPGLFTADAPALSIYVNGCPNSCARAQVADIGLKGLQVPDPADPDGGTVDGFQIHLGGRLGEEAGFGRKLRGLRTTSAELPDYVERVVRNWLKQRGESEAFAEWVLRADEADLR